MIKHYYGIAASALLLGLFPAFSLPTLQVILILCLISVFASFGRIDLGVVQSLLQWRYLVFMQFCVYFFINAAVYPVWTSARMHYQGVELETWSLTLLCLIVLGLWLSLQNPKDIKRALINWLPLGLTLSFGMATVFYFSSQTGDFSNQQGARIPLFASNPLIPPFWFLVLSVTCFTWFSEMSKGQKIWRFALFFMAGVMTVYGGARLIFLAWILCAGVLSIWLVLQVPAQKRMNVLVGTIGGGVFCAGGIVLADSLGPGYLLERLAIFSQMDFTYKGLSTHFLRIRIWEAALSVIDQNTWLGVGKVNERLAIRQEAGWVNWLEAHQTYFSYLIAGGIPALICGLVMQSSVFALLPKGRRAIFAPAFLGLGLVVFLNSLVDSTFQSGTNVQVFMLTVLFYLKARDVSSHPVRKAP